jgi:hypothetical protein
VLAAVRWVIFLFYIYFCLLYGRELTVCVCVYYFTSTCGGVAGVERGRVGGQVEGGGGLIVD